jgi:hypothetical protein
MFQSATGEGEKSREIYYTISYDKSTMWHGLRSCVIRIDEVDTWKATHIKRAEHQTSSMDDVNPRHDLLASAA